MADALQQLPQVSSQMFKSSKASQLLMHKMAQLPKETLWQQIKRGRCWPYIYDKEHKTFLGRTCSSWGCIIAYGIMYLIFLTTFTLMILFLSLLVIRATGLYFGWDHTQTVLRLPLTYGNNGVGLSITPTMEGNYPMIWYKDKDPEDYKIYVSAIDRLLLSDRRKNNIKEREALGPCGQPPYGYGNNPCIYVRINRQYLWKGVPMLFNSTQIKSAPPEVQNWVKTGKKLLWVHCSGFHLYDKEHIGTFKYYPDPPGIDPSIFPLDVNTESPLIGVQISSFTHGVSLGVQCSLWYEDGLSSKEFLLYVVSANSSVLGRTQSGSFYGEYD